LYDRAVDPRDARVVERGERPRLALESLSPIRVAGKGVGQVFSATSRWSFVSRARNTCPIPPWPMAAVTS
jgi:hypothetical protein